MQHFTSVLPELGPSTTMLAVAGTEMNTAWVPTWVSESQAVERQSREPVLQDDLVALIATSSPQTSAVIPHRLVFQVPRVQRVVCAT